MNLRSASECRWDLVGLGEVMLRLDPGPGRIHTTRTFRAWEGGGEYNVARGLRRCFGKRTAIVTALADNPVGRLLEDLMLQGGVDLSLLKWMEYDGIGRTARNGLNFTERGFGPRAGLGCSDRGHTAASQMQPDDTDWKLVLGVFGARWLHSGGIFCALSKATRAVAKRAFKVARQHKTIVSYDLNYRESLWRSAGGQNKAQRINRDLLESVDVLFGNEEDLTAALGYPVGKEGKRLTELHAEDYRRAIDDIVDEYPNISAVAVTLRSAKSASVNGWGALCYYEGDFFEVPQRDVEIYDRVGGGDSFASGFIYGLMEGRGPQWALQCGVVHGALAMSTPGDTTMATRAEVERYVQAPSARIKR